jgi:hypothetical protein
MLHLLVQAKSAQVCEADNRQINSRVFEVNGLSPCLVAFPHLHCPLPPHLDVGENATVVRDGLHCHSTFFRHWPVLRHKTTFFEGT